jgi:opacity protein-like surface antigen
MKHFLHSLIVILLLGVGIGFAQQSEAGFFAGARFGLSALDTPKERDRPGAGLLGYDRESKTWSVLVGHQWQISPHLLVGLEAAYTDNGHANITYASANEYEFKSTQLDFLASGTLALGRGISVYGKAGVGRVRQEYFNSKYVSGTPDINTQWTKDLPVAAAGFGYQISSRLCIFIEARRTFGERTEKVTQALTNSNPTPPPYRDMLTSVARVSVVSAGFILSF